MEVELIASTAGVQVLGDEWADHVVKVRSPFVSILVVSVCGSSLNPCDPYRTVVESS
jgi:hypothetical protein